MRLEEEKTKEEAVVRQRLQKTSLGLVLVGRVPCFVTFMQRKQECCGQEEGPVQDTCSCVQGKANDRCGWQGVKAQEQQSSSLLIGRSECRAQKFGLGLGL